MRVVVAIAALNVAHGGPARTVPALCRAMTRCGADVRLVTVAERGRAMFFDRSEAGFECVAVHTGASRYHPFSWRGDFLQALRAQLATNGRAVLYDVGLWLPSNHFAAEVSRRTGAPLVSSPRGMLSDNALKVAAWKKRIAWALYQKRDLRVARAVHATSETEAADCRRRGIVQPIVVVPNGVDLPPEAPSHHARGRESTRIALFLSRLHPIKGLPDLVTAWAAVRPPGWRMVIAGPDEKGHRAVIEALVARHNLEEQFEFRGPVSDADKWDLYATADVFVLPSYSESFGQVVAEALAAGLPVITTRATPWSDIEARGCGWWIPPGHEPLRIALAEATSRSTDELKSLGRRGRELATSKYTWAAAAEKLLALFESITEAR